MPAPTILITEKAAAQVAKLAAAEGKPGAALRVAVQGGGCSGLTYKLSYDYDERSRARNIWRFRPPSNATMSLNAV